MRTSKALLISTIVLLFVLSSGCMSKKWSYDFTSATATIDDWYFYSSLSGNYRLDDAGLCLDNAFITTPVYFNGEMSVKVFFELDVSELSTVALDFGLSDGILWSGNNETWAGLWGIGNEMEEGWKLGDYGSGNQTEHEHDEPIPNLNRDGSNTIEFKRIGNTVSLYINGDKIGETDLIYFDIHTDGFFPTISCEGAIGTFTITRVEVRYDGGISEQWPV